MSKTKRANKWPPIYKQTNRSGQPTFYVDLRAVGGGRPGYPTLEAAQSRADLARTEKQNEGTAAFALPMAVRVDAAKAHQILSPHGVSIFEAARHYDRHVLAYKSAPIIRDIVERHLADAEDRNLRPRAIDDLRHRLNSFAADFGERRLSEIALDELKDWFADDGWMPRTRINFHTKISQLYNYAVRHKWVDSNLTEHIDRPRADETTPEIFTVEQAERLLNHAGTFDLLPYIAIGLFAGVRSAEMMRLDAKDISFESKTIRIGPDVAKKRSHRIIEMLPALLSWLEPYRDTLQAGGRIITQAKFRSNQEDLLLAAGIQEWPANGLRHSYASYHLSMFESAEKTSHQMGNSADMVHKHYKALVTKESAEKFWALRPQ